MEVVIIKMWSNSHIHRIDPGGPTIWHRVMVSVNLAFHLRRETVFFIERWVVIGVCILTLIAGAYFDLPKYLGVR